ncbi:putative DnaJ type IV chaperone protein [Synechococcus sp. BIOS-E4-1]|uniref:hypothetical protein n=1 Tax=Synechococcus sp. BIOS-E4-1 TaxID=1400864 RepID=UPI00164599D0|nr:hypothetical protein [Synechococcus sp. BIOS-E4-1]QNI56101.1 putative DnaJ type IV chaperone protein [Synechococcus sp. BIOS-E4-1]
MAICSSCGGSGIKRITEQRFRTCQNCLGRGVVQPVSTSIPSTTGGSVVHSLEERAERFKEDMFRAAATSASAK